MTGQVDTENLKTRNANLRDKTIVLEEDKKQALSDLKKLQMVINNTIKVYGEENGNS